MGFPPNGDTRTDDRCTRTERLALQNGVSILMLMPLRVLVADDSAVVRTALARRFRSAGAEVVEAASVAEAKAVDPGAVDVAVLDFDLGDGYGDAIAAHLHAVRPGLPLCFFTSSTQEAREKASPYGRIFTKPEQADQVIAWVLAAQRSMV